MTKVINCIPGILSIILCVAVLLLVFSEKTYWIQLISSLCLGAVVAWLLRHTLVRTHDLSLKSLGAMVAVTLGGAVIGFFKYVSSINPDEGRVAVVYFYPIGLLIGMLFVASFQKLTGSQEPMPAATNWPK
jgi:hypothetical protein